MSDLLQQADDHLQAADYSAAIMVYSRWLVEHPEDVGAHRGLGIARLESGDLAGAAVSFDRALELSPQNGELFYQRARPHLRAKEYDLALPYLDRAVALQPDYADAYWSRGWIRSMHKDHVGELADSLKYCELKPAEAQGFGNLAYVYRQLEQFEASLTAAQSAVAINPNLAEGYRQLGYTLKAMGRRVQAADAFAQAIKLKPDCAAELGPELAQLHLAEETAPITPSVAPVSKTSVVATRRKIGWWIKDAFSNIKSAVLIIFLGLGALAFVLGLVGAIGVGVGKGVDIAYGSSYIVYYYNDAQRVPPSAQLCKKMFCRDPHTTQKHLAGSPGHQSEYLAYFCDQHERSPWLSFFDMSHLGGAFWVIAGLIACVVASLIFGLIFWLVMMPVALPLMWWRKRNGYADAPANIAGVTASVAACFGVLAGVFGTVIYIWF